MKTIGICPSRTNDIDFLGTSRVIEQLYDKAILILPESLENAVVSAMGDYVRERVRFVSEDELYTAPDVLIVLGGDGSILKAARRCAGGDAAILGINLGRIGYMAELEIDELSLLDRIAEGDYRVEKRMMLEATIGGERLYALNEAVLGGASIFRIVEIELYCDGNLVNRYRADGLIASTPTGSTAYSMSAGGAVVDPRMDAMIVTPICSHSLSATPLVFSAESELIMENVTEREEQLYLNVDGCEMRTLAYGETVTLRKGDKNVNFIRLKDGGFYQVLRHKMADKH
ncbi:MAG: NAD(+)/NADH kinase [Clostridia bacterium]|nr:NAD(+)/NADH kinase [Clostridia bacterium]